MHVVYKNKSTERGVLSKLSHQTVCKRYLNVCPISFYVGSELTSQFGISLILIINGCNLRPNVEPTTSKGLQNWHNMQGVNRTAAFHGSHCLWKIEKFVGVLTGKALRFRGCRKRSAAQHDRWCMAWVALYMYKFCLQQRVCMCVRACVCVWWWHASVCVMYYTARKYHSWRLESYTQHTQYIYIINTQIKCRKL